MLLCCYLSVSPNLPFLLRTVSSYIAIAIFAQNRVGSSDACILDMDICDSDDDLELVWPPDYDSDDSKAAEHGAKSFHLP